MSDYSTTGAKNGRDYGARHPILRGSIVLHHGCVLAYGQRAPRAPHRKCRRIRGRYFNREKSGDVAARTWVRTGSYRPRIRAGYVVFFQETLRIARRLRIREARCRVFKNVRGESAYPNTPDPRRYCLASATSSTTFASRSVPIHLLALIHSCGAIHSLRPCNRRSCGPFRCT